MERLTDLHFKKSDGFYMKCSGHCYKEDFSCEDCEEFEKLVDRLGEIEDILGDDYDLDRLRKLVDADRNGRIVVFKFGIGSTVYRAWVRPDGSHPFISEENMNTMQDLVNAETWPDSYATREAAESALKGEKNG